LTFIPNYGQYFVAHPVDELRLGKRKNVIFVDIIGLIGSEQVTHGVINPKYPALERRHTQTLPRRLRETLEEPKLLFERL
jgi:hypothetical protein